MQFMSPTFIMNMLGEIKSARGHSIMVNRKLLLNMLEQFYTIRKSISENDIERMNFVRDATAETMILWVQDVIEDIQHAEDTDLTMDEGLVMLHKALETAKNKTKETLIVGEA